MTIPQTTTASVVPSTPRPRHTMRSDSLIQATEIWRPDPDGYLLEFAGGYYGDSLEFDAVSRAMVFGRGEGLPGRVWEEGRAIPLETLQGANFRRAKAARKAGLDAAIGLPFGVDGQLAAVVVFFFASSPPGAIATLLAGLGGEVPEGLFGPTATPVARRVEHWALDTSGQRLVRVRGLDGGAALPAGELAEDAAIDQGLVAEVFADGVPELLTDDEGATACTIALPVHRDGAVVAVVTMSW